MQPEVYKSYEEIAQLPVQVLSLYQKMNINIPPNSNLEKYMRICSNLDTNIEQLFDVNFLLDVSRAKRVLEAIVSCPQVQEAKEPLTRIAKHSLITNTEEHSQGKDALFELEFFQYLQHRHLEVKLGEPDIIVNLPFGKYYIACKTINSLKNFEGQLRSGYHQIEKYGQGCIAFNLEPHLSINEPLVISHIKEAMPKLRILIQDIIKEWKILLNRKLVENRFDGIIFQMTCIVDCEYSQSRLDTFTKSYFFCDSQAHKNQSSARFLLLANLLQGQLNEKVPNYSPLSLHAKALLNH